MIKRLIVAITGLGILLSLLLNLVLFGKSPVVFESLESKTPQNDPVFNRVDFVFGWDKDIWFMQQSHHGFNQTYANWDRLAIVVNKTVKPYQAVFYQLNPGDLTLTEPMDSIPLKAQCFACHANGPRAIRPKIDSIARLTAWGTVRLQFWNLLIRSYGKIDGSSGEKKSVAGTSFRSSLKYMGQQLPLKSCRKCHAENGIRNPLKLEHLTTAKFLIDNKLMPPFPYQIWKGDLQLLRRLSSQFN